MGLIDDMNRLGLGDELMKTVGRTLVKTGSVVDANVTTSIAVSKATDATLEKVAKRVGADCASVRVAARGVLDDAAKRSSKVSGHVRNAIAALDTPSLNKLASISTGKAATVDAQPMLTAEQHAAALNKIADGCDPQMARSYRNLAKSVLAEDTARKAARPTSAEDLERAAGFDRLASSVHDPAKRRAYTAEAARLRGGRS